MTSWSARHWTEIYRVKPVADAVRLGSPQFSPREDAIGWTLLGLRDKSILLIPPVLAAPASEELPGDPGAAAEAPGLPDGLLEPEG
jgi:hypothetical protein